MDGYFLAIWILARFAAMGVGEVRALIGEDLVGSRPIPVRYMPMRQMPEGTGRQVDHLDPAARTPTLRSAALPEFLRGV